MSCYQVNASHWLRDLSECGPEGGMCGSFNTLREHVPTATGFRVPWRNSSLGALNVIFVHPKINVSLFLSSGMIVYRKTIRDNLLYRMKTSNDDTLSDVKKNSSATPWAARLGRYMDNLRFWDHPRADGDMSHEHQATRLPTCHSRHRGWIDSAQTMTISPRSALFQELANTEWV